MIPVGWDEILSCFPGILAVLQTLCKVYIVITREKFS